MVFDDPTLIMLAIATTAYLVMLGNMLLQGRPGLRAGGLAGPEPAARHHIYRAAARWTLLAFLIASLGWSLALLLWRLQARNAVSGFDTFYLVRIAMYLLLALAVIFLQLTRLFLRRGSLDTMRRDLPVWAGGTAWLLIVVILYESVRNFPERQQVAFFALVLGWGAAMSATLIRSGLDYYRTVSPLHRNRDKYWSIAVILTIAGGGLAFAQQAFAASLLHLLGALVAVYVLQTYDLPDLRTIARGAGSFVIMTALTMAVYAGGFLAAQSILRAGQAHQLVLIAVVLAAALAVLFNPLLQVVNRFVNHLISGARYDARQTLSEFSMTISTILDMDVLASVVIGMISEAMEISHGALVTVTRAPSQETIRRGEDDPGEFLLHITRGKPETGTLVPALAQLAEDPTAPAGALPHGRLSGKNPVVSYLRREHRPLTQYDIDMAPGFQAMDAAERDWLKALQVDVYVPIYTNERWAGLLALGPKVSGDRYFDEDLAFLQTIADQTAVALENARLYDNLKQRNTENERLNVRLTAANQELARLDKAKSDFINIASHELRTPLTQVKGFNDLLSEMVKSHAVELDSAEQMTDAVSRATQRLEDIVETMFDVSKVDTNTLDLECAPVSLASILTAAVETWRKGLQERAQSISVEGISGLPQVCADGRRLTQVFANLIQNAIKFTPDRGQISVSGRVTCPTDPAEQFVEITVADTGIGIAAEDLERIFEKFYRVGNVLLHSTGDTKFKGAGPGLGLTIARGIVEAHGGRIRAESPGHDEEKCPGARFIVLLPVSQD